MNEKELVEELLRITPTATENSETIINTKQMFNERSKEILKELAERYRKTGIYGKTKAQTPDWLKIANAAEVYLHMCDRIINAPTTLHLICVPRILIPTIWDKIQEEELGNGSRRKTLKEILSCSNEKGDTGKHAEAKEES